MKKYVDAIMRRGVWVICWFLPIVKKKIVFTSYFGRGYGDNPKYIAEELLNNGQYNLIWLIKNDCDKNTLPPQIKAVKINSIKGIYHLSTAKIWIDNCRKSFIYKKRKQVYIQTWHGFALKKIEKDVQDNLSVAYVKKAIKDSKKIDIIISDSKHMTEIYKHSFWYTGEIVEWGSPRNDIIIDVNKQKYCYDKVCNFYQIKEGNIIILYAPTFRANNTMDAYSIDLEKVISAFEKKYSSNCTVIVRLHPNIAEKSSELPFVWNDKVVDVSQYPDTQEILSASDVVISDYSSLMFDFALSYKPCFQFATDINDYIKDRNFYFRIDSLPFPLSKDNEELLLNIKEFDYELYKQQLLNFFNQIQMNRFGNAVKMCVNYIEQITK